MNPYVLLLLKGYITLLPMASRYQGMHCEVGNAESLCMHHFLASMHNLSWPLETRIAENMFVISKLTYVSMKDKHYRLLV